LWLRKEKFGWELSFEGSTVTGRAFLAGPEDEKSLGRMRYLFPFLFHCDLRNFPNPKWIYHEHEIVWLYISLGVGSQEQVMRIAEKTEIRSPDSHVIRRSPSRYFLLICLWTGTMLREYEIGERGEGGVSI